MLKRIVTIFCVLSLVTGLLSFQANAATSNDQLWKIYKAEAQKWGIDIKGLTLEKAKTKIITVRQEILDREAKKLNVDIKGLSVNDAAKKIKEAQEAEKLRIALEKEAKKVGVDIEGLKPEEAKAKIIAARVEQQTKKLQEKAAELNIDIEGLSNAEAWEKIKAAEEAGKEDEKLSEFQDKAKKLGIDITGLTLEEIKIKIDMALKELKEQKAEFRLEDYDGLMKALTDKNITVEEKKKYLKMIGEEAKKLGLDISGLSFEEAIKKIKETLKSAEKSSDEGAGIYTVSDDLAKLLYAIKKNDKTTAVKIMQSGAFLKIKDLSSLSTIPYDTLKSEIGRKSDDNPFYEVYVKCNTLDEFKAAIRKAFIEGMKKDAEFYGVDIKGMTEAQIVENIETARQLYFAKEQQELLETAQKLGVDIKGLSKEEAWSKIKALYMKQNSPEEEKKRMEENKQWLMIMLDEARNMGMDVSGISLDEKTLTDKNALPALKEKINLFRDKKENDSRLEAAKSLGIDITGMSRDDAERAIILAGLKRFGITNAVLSGQTGEALYQAEMKAYADKFGIDITGLSREQAWSKIKPAMKAFEEAERQKADAERLKKEQEQQQQQQQDQDQKPVVMTYEGIFLQLAAGRLGLDTQLDVEPMRAEVGAALGMDLTGLMGGELVAKINEGLKAKGLPILE